MHNTPHSIMFHHFHSETHPVGQGSLSSEDFEDILDWLDQHYNLISARDYFDKAINHLLRDNDVCLSFDDALLCQYDIAVPILDSRNLSAFFFIYSSPMAGEADLLEVFRYFRTVEFETIDQFYDVFFNIAKSDKAAKYETIYKKFSSLNYLKDFPFYSDNDRWFRYLRDQVMGKEIYEETMLSLMRKKGFDVNAVMEKLWIGNDHLKYLNAKNHMIELHSYSHPTMMHNLPILEQKKEFQQNKEHLQSVLPQIDIATMSHPCGNYDQNTLDILDSMGIKVGFRSNMSRKNIKSLLEIPREDHTNVFKEINK